MTDLLPSAPKRQKRSKQQVPSNEQNGHSSSSELAHLSSVCGCGKCTVSTFLQKGCPKPSSTLLESLPDIDGPSDSNQLIRRGKLYLEHEQICSVFSSLEPTLLKSFTSRKVTVEVLSQILQSISAFQPPHTHTPLLTHQLTTLKGTKTLSQLLKLVSSFISFFNSSLLEQLVDKLGSEADKAELDKYKTQFNEYAKRNVFECPSFHNANPQSDFCELVLKVDKDFSKLSVSNLAVFMDWLSSFLMVTRASIQLVSVSKRESCHVEMVYPQLSKEVELVCRLSNVVREAVLPFSPEQEDMLKAAGILEVHCGEVHQVMAAVPQSTASIPISDHPATEYFNNLTIAQAAMLLNPPHTVHDHTVSRTSKNGHTHDSLLRGTPVYGDSFLPPSSTVAFTQSDLASQFLTSRADGPGTSSRDEQPSAEGPGSEVSDSDDDGDKPKPKPAPGKKTRGRVKIPMKYIKNKLRRYTTFSKRKSNIMKKAYELSTLTGTQVMLMVASETGHVYTFATPKLQPMITSEAGKALIQTCLHQPDIPPPVAPPTSSADQFAVRMSSAGYEEVELGGYKLGSEEQKNDKGPPTSLSSLLPLPSSFTPDIASLMPVLSSIRPPPLSSPDYTHMKIDSDGK